MRHRILGFSLGLGLLAAAGPAAGQAFYYVPAPTTAAPATTGGAYVARVVDARPVHASLGLVVRAGKARAATFHEGVASTLQAFFAARAGASPGAVPLVLRLSGLEIAEMPGSLVEGRLAEQATAGLAAAVYAPQPDSSYQLVLRFADLRQTGAYDATGEHAANLGSLLHEVAGLSSQPAAWLRGGPRFSRAQVLASQPLPGEGLLTQNLGGQRQPGFYGSLVDFWLDRPSEPGVPVVEQVPSANPEWAGELETKAYRLLGGRRVPATDVWGFSDGQTVYIRRGRSFYRLEQRGTDFFFTGPASEDPVYRRASSDRAGNNVAVLGGVLGSTLAGAVDAATVSGPRTLLRLSPLTGEVRLAQSNSAAATGVAGRPTHLFIYRPRGEKGPPVSIQLADDQPPQQLAAGDFLTFEPPSDAPLRVAVRAGAGPARHLAIAPTSEAPTYLECRPGSPEPLQKVTDKAGAAALGKLLK